MNDHRNAPDPEGLAIARKIQKAVHPSEIILGGSRAAGDHRPAPTWTDLPCWASNRTRGDSGKQTACTWTMWGGTPSTV